MSNIKLKKNNAITPDIAIQNNYRANEINSDIFQFENNNQSIFEDKMKEEEKTPILQQIDSDKLPMLKIPSKARPRRSSFSGQSPRGQEKSPLTDILGFSKKVNRQQTAKSMTHARNSSFNA